MKFSPDLNSPQCWTTIAGEVEEILNNKTKGIFIYNILAFADNLEMYTEALEQRPKVVEDADGNIQHPTFQDYKPLPTDPFKWEEMENKYPSYYTFLAFVYDTIKGDVAPYELLRIAVEDNNKYENLITCLRLCPKNIYFSEEHLNTALKWVKEYIQKQEEKVGSSNESKVDSPNKKSSQSLFWKLYEKTVKAAFDAILDKVNPR